MISLIYLALYFMLSIVESKRKKQILLLDTFRYTEDKIVNTTVYCKCEDCSCPGRAIQYGSDPPNGINIRTLYKKSCALAFMSPQEVGKIWTVIIARFQDIEHIEVFYDYVTNRWVDDDALFDLSLWNYFDFKSSRTNNS
ncbi:unnamed protein product [Didymodactylos carnosus]|uniref:Uncharacterized protein n=1 Tax=Didymodactylos carnosus TaxID=1234261 RepID=A0A814S130_9BILA|nr:unnamed protein product [Didymodactylos carnosus]CAF1139085.1 unnamed protein product [Didymodactylos carnosus]CAF3701454.1 unnamed protein product [Didymodactylos carnosus]CAF3902798.1 unnamed protein product [Didymodactylos carnosus]